MVRARAAIPAPTQRVPDGQLVDRVAVGQRIEELRHGLAALEADVADLLRALDAATASSAAIARGSAASALDTQEATEYLSLRELARRIPYAEQTIRNLMSRGVFRMGEHYIKPRARVMFRWSRMREWLDQHSTAR